MTLTFILDLDQVRVNHSKYLGHRSFHLRVIVRTDIHTLPIDCSTWTTKVVDN